MIVLIVMLAFLIGSIPTGLLIAKAKGVDLRTVGSGNIGATNALRALGKEAALMTLVGDIAKGIISVLLARTVDFPAEQVTLIEGMSGLAAVLGHNFSVFLKFKGGKGVATSLGVLFAYSPYAALLTATIWLMTVKRTRYSSLAALVSFGVLPLSVYLLDYSPQKLIVAVLIAGLIFVRHASNIRRLVQGTEPKVGQKA